MLCAGLPGAVPESDACTAPTDPHTLHALPLAYRPTPMTLHPVQAFDDNYIWVLDDGHRAVVVDPGDARPVAEYLSARSLVLDTILVTHHHGDHVGGVAELLRQTPARVIGPATEKLPVPVERVRGDDTLNLLNDTVHVRVLDVPGHTAGHVAYLVESGSLRAPILFCGDTLFSGGCGRLFEGTAAQMLTSLDQLAALAPETLVCAAHEYTLSNLKFALAVDPANTALAAHQATCQQLRAKAQPTLPSTIGLERQINPFLRVREPAVAERVARHADLPVQTPVEVFAAMREWKNVFR